MHIFESENSDPEFYEIIKKNRLTSISRFYSHFNKKAVYSHNFKTKLSLSFFILSYNFYFLNPLVKIFD